MPRWNQENIDSITGDDTFRINDIILRIPPTKISISKAVQDFRYDMVRSGGPIYVRSGRAVATMNLNISFVGESEVEILQRLVAEIELSPFVHIENEHVRANMEGALPDGFNMAWCARSLSVMQQEPDHIQCHMVLDWFNYLPYSTMFTFKKNVEKDPEKIKMTTVLEESEPYQRWISHYLQNSNFNKYLRKTNPEYDMSLVFVNYMTVPHEERAENVTLPAGRTNIWNWKPEMSAEEEAESAHSVKEGLTEREKAEQAAISNIEAQARVMASDNPADLVAERAELAKELVRKSYRGKLRDFNDIVEIMALGGWKFFENTGPIQFKANTENKTGDTYDIFWRPEILLFSRPGIVITNISANFQHHYARLPIAGQNYATIQHLGGIDKGVQIDMLVNGIKNMEMIQRYWEQLQQAVLRLRLLTRNNVCSVENNLLNALGINYLIPQSLEHSTIEGQPGTYAVSMLFVVPAAKTASEELELHRYTEWSENKLIEEFIIYVLKNLQTNASLQEIAKRHGLYDVIFGDFNAKVGSEFKGPDKLIFRTQWILGGPLYVQETDILALFHTHPELFDDLIARDLFKDVIAEKLESKVMGMDKNARDIRNMVPYRLEYGPGGDVIDYTPGDDYLLTRYAAPGRAGTFSIEQTSPYRKRYTVESVVKSSKYAVDKYLGWLKDKYKEQFAKLIQELNGDIKKAAKEVIRHSIGILPQLDKFKERFEKLGVLQGSSAYPDLRLEGLGENYINPDFYFYPEGLAAWDSTGINNLILEAQKMANKEWEWLFNDDQLAGWVKNEYLEKHLPPDKRKKFNENVKKLREKMADRQKRALAKMGEKAPNKIEPSVASEVYGLFDGVGTRKNAAAAYRDRKGSPMQLLMNKDKVPGGVTSQKELSISFDTSELFGGVASDDAIGNKRGSTIVPKEGLHAPLTPNAVVSSEWGAKRSLKSRTVRTLPNVPPSLPYLPKIAPRRDVEEKYYYHAGIDFWTPRQTEDGGTDGTIHAIYDGVVRSIRNTYEPRSCSISVNHPELGMITFYQHIDRTQVYVKTGQTVKAGQELGKIYPHADSHSYSKKNFGHLHFEIHVTNKAKFEDAFGKIPPEQTARGRWGAKKSAWINVNPAWVLSKRVNIRDMHEVGILSGASLLSKSVNQLIDSVAKNNIPRMVRAFPAFKLYFIEEDTIDGDGRRLTQFDDLFGWAAVHSITIQQSEDNPVDTAIVTVSNVSGNLTNRRFGHDTEHAYDAKGHVVTEKHTAENEEKENPIKSFFLQEGLKVAICLGYDARPRNLPIVLVGTVSGVEMNNTTDMLTVSIDSYGYELVQRVKAGEEAKEHSSGWIVFEGGETQTLLEDMLYSDEVKHFGRWEVGDKSILRAALTDRWEVIPNPYDDNIFAPDSSSIDGGGGIIFEHNRYFVWRTTIWDIFQEMTYRHPECITRPVPYWGKRGPRLTMFFGIPSQLYFARDLKWSEEAEVTAAGEAIQRGDLEIADYAEGERHDRKLLEETVREMKSSDIDISDFLLKKGIETGAIRPFRSYHIATSWGNIVANNIKATPDGVCNTVKLQYSEVDDIDERIEFEMHYWDSGMIEMNSHWTIPDHLVRERYIPQEMVYNCETWDLANRYALKFLKEGLRKMYKGELVLLGNPDIKPHDIVYIFDTYSDMVGPIEVGSVTHFFSKDTGFVTMIKPRASVHVNEWASMTLADALGYIVQRFTGLPIASDDVSLSNYKSTHSGLKNVSYTGINIGAIAGAGELVSLGHPITAAAALIGYGLLLLGGRKVVGWSQYGTPIIINPLVMHGKELTAGTGFRYTQNKWWARKIGPVYRWLRDGEEGLHDIMVDFWDKWGEFWQEAPFEGGGHWWGRNK